VGRERLVMVTFNIHSGNGLHDAFAGHPQRIRHVPLVQSEEPIRMVYERRVASPGSLRRSDHAQGLLDRAQAKRNEPCNTCS
jgi:hypothetical protein